MCVEFLPVKCLPHRLLSHTFDRLSVSLRICLLFSLMLAFHSHRPLIQRKKKKIKSFNGLMEDIATGSFMKLAIYLLL